MASTRIVEQDHGSYTGLVTHHHNGYYAGDFRTTQQLPRTGSRSGPVLVHVREPGRWQSDSLGDVR